ncbi:hypothetical protein L1887_53809 [Cichorium endivia]|nr:hypothetical protein L1887_53809 [Cichorium endivia]
MPWLAEAKFRQPGFSEFREQGSRRLLWIFVAAFLWGFFLPEPGFAGVHSAPPLAAHPLAQHRNHHHHHQDPAPA